MPTTLTTTTVAAGYGYAINNKVAYLWDNTLIWFDSSTGTNGQLYHITSPGGTPSNSTTQAFAIASSTNVVGDIYVLNNGNSSNDIWIYYGSNGNALSFNVAHGTYDSSGVFAWDNTGTNISGSSGSVNVGTIVWTGTYVVIAARDDPSSTYNVRLNWTSTKAGNSGWNGWVTLSSSGSSSNSHFFPLLLHDSTLAATIAVYTIADKIVGRVLPDSSTPAVANWGSEVTIQATPNNVGAANLTAFFDHTGQQLHVGWCDSTGGTSHSPAYVNTSSITVNGTSSTMAFNTTIAIATSTTATSPHIAMDQNGKLYYFWATSTSGSASDVDYVTIASPYGSGNVSSTTNLSNASASNNVFPHVPHRERSTQGYIPVLYQQNTGSPWNIEYDNSITVSTSNSVTLTDTLTCSDSESGVGQETFTDTLSIDDTSATTYLGAMTLTDTLAVIETATEFLQPSYTIIDTATGPATDSATFTEFPILADVLAIVDDPYLTWAAFSTITDASAIQEIGAQAEVPTTINVPLTETEVLSVLGLSTYTDALGELETIAFGNSTPVSLTDIALVSSDTEMGVLIATIADVAATTSDSQSAIENLAIVGTQFNLVEVYVVPGNALQVAPMVETLTGPSGKTETEIIFTDTNNNGWAVGLDPTYGGANVGAWYEIDNGVWSINQVYENVPDGFTHAYTQSSGASFIGSETNPFTMTELAPAGTRFRRYYQGHSPTAGNDANGFQWNVFTAIYPGDPGFLVQRIDCINTSGSPITLASSDSLEIAILAGLQQANQSGVWTLTNSKYGTVSGGDVGQWPTSLTGGQPDYWYITPVAGRGVSLGAIGVAGTNFSNFGSSVSQQGFVNANRIKVKVQWNNSTFAANTTKTFYVLQALRRNIAASEPQSIAADYLNPGTPTMTAGTFTRFSQDEGAYIFAADGTGLNCQFTVPISAPVTKRWMNVYKVTGYTASIAPQCLLAGITLNLGVDYTSYADTVNQIAYVRILKGLVPGSPGATELLNGTITVSAGNVTLLTLNDVPLVASDSISELGILQPADTTIPSDSISFVEAGTFAEPGLNIDDSQTMTLLMASVSDSGDSLTALETETGIGAETFADQNVLSDSESGLLGATITDVTLVATDVVSTVNGPGYTPTEVALLPSEAESGVGAMSLTDTLAALLESQSGIGTLSLTDSVAASDVLSGQFQLAQTDTLNSTETETALGAISFTEQLTLTETTSQNSSPANSYTDTLTILDDAFLSFISSMTLTDIGLVNTETSSVIAVLVQSFTELLTVSESLSEVGLETLTDTPTLVEAILMVSQESFVEAVLTVTETVNPTGQPTVTDSLATAELLVGFVEQGTFTDTLAEVEVVSYTIISAPFDTLSSIDSITFNVFSALTDIVSANDAYSGIFSTLYTDISLLPADSISGIGAETFVDQASASDIENGLLAFQITDVITGPTSDNVNDILFGVFSDTAVTTSDSQSGVEFQTITDVPNGTLIADSIILNSSPNFSLTDSVSSVESITFSLQASYTDLLNIIETTGGGQIYNDTMVCSDSFSILGSTQVSDSVTLGGESISYQYQALLIDVLSATDSVSWAVVLQNLISVSTKVRDGVVGAHTRDGLYSPPTMVRDGITNTEVL